MRLTPELPHQGATRRASQERSGDEDADKSLVFSILVDHFGTVRGLFRTSEYTYKHPDLVDLKAVQIHS